MEINELESPETAFWNRLQIEAEFRIGVVFLNCENMNKLKRFSDAKLFQYEKQLFLIQVTL